MVSQKETKELDNNTFSILRPFNSLIIKKVKKCKIFLFILLTLIKYYLIESINKK